jgi:hypothetical protein
VEQGQGLRAIPGTGVADWSAVDFDEGSFVRDLVSSGRIYQFAIHHIFPAFAVDLSSVFDSEKHRGTGSAF